MLSYFLINENSKYWKVSHGVTLVIFYETGKIVSRVRHPGYVREVWFNFTLTEKSDTFSSDKNAAWNLDQECENPVFDLFMKMSLNVNLLLFANLSRRPCLIHDSISKIHDTNFHLFHRFWWIFKISDYLQIGTNPK